jgi:hypothetical protein
MRPKQLSGVIVTRNKRSRRENNYTAYLHRQTKCSRKSGDAILCHNKRLRHVGKLLKMGILMPETC